MEEPSADSVDSEQTARASQVSYLSLTLFMFVSVFGFRESRGKRMKLEIQYHKILGFSLWVLKMMKKKRLWHWQWQWQSFIFLYMCKY